MSESDSAAKKIENDLFCYAVLLMVIENIRANVFGSIFDFPRLLIWGLKNNLLVIFAFSHKFSTTSSLSIYKKTLGPNC